MTIFWEMLHVIAPLDALMVPAYRIHILIGTIFYHLLAYRDEQAGRNWQLKGSGDRLIENSALAYSYETNEMLEIYLNSLFTAFEVHDLGRYFYEKFGIEIAVLPQPFPLPLPIAYFELISREDSDGYDGVTVGDPVVSPPQPFLAFLFDTLGEGAQLPADVPFRDLYGFKERHDGRVHSFILKAEDENFPLEFDIYGYSEQVSNCFIDRLKGVHTRIVREHASDGK